jgi:hypothetical protein
MGIEALATYLARETDWVLLHRQALKPHLAAPAGSLQAWMLMSGLCPLPLGMYLPLMEPQTVN